MKMKFLFVFISLLFAATACRQDAPPVNQNSQTSVSPTVTPGSSESGSKNVANIASAPETNANQIFKPTPTASPSAKASVSPIVSPTVSTASKFKNYTAKGVIKKIDIENGSVTIDHEDIGDYMVGMEMPFPVVNKNILSGLKAGDAVTFVLETGVGVERIVSIKKN